MNASLLTRTAGYVGWNGPFEEVESSSGQRLALVLKLQPHHLNTGDRMHGALVMGLMKLTCERAARACLGPQSVVRLDLASMQLDFVDAAAGGERVEGRADITRMTRRLVFVRAEVGAGDRILATGSAIFRQSQPRQTAQSPPTLSEATLQAPAGYGPPRARAPFSCHAGPVHEQQSTESPDTVLPILSHHLDSEGGTRADEGAALLLADLALGSCARTAAGGKSCVALSMQLSRFGDAHLGDLLLARPRHAGFAGGIHAISAEFYVGDKQVMSAAGSWKVLHAS